MSSPVTALTGMFMLTWAWLGFNCGSTFGVTDHKWKISAVVAVSTLNGAIGGGLVGLLLSMIHYRGQVRVEYVINSILGGLVSVTGICSVVTTSEAFVVGGMGAFVAIYATFVLEWVKVDDPVGAVPVHFAAALWGTLAVGIFGKDNMVQSLHGTNGILHGGGGRLLGVNLLGAVIIIAWSAIVTFLMLTAIRLTMGIRMSAEDEYLGADYVEHNIHSLKLTERLEEALRKMDEDKISKLIQRLFTEISNDTNPKTNAEGNVAIKVLKDSGILSGASVLRKYPSRPQSVRTPFGHHLSVRPVRSVSSSVNSSARTTPATYELASDLEPINIPRLEVVQELSVAKVAAVKRRDIHASTFSGV